MEHVGELFKASATQIQERLRQGREDRIGRRKAERLLLASSRLGACDPPSSTTPSEQKATGIAVRSVAQCFESVSDSLVRIFLLGTRRIGSDVCLSCTASALKPTMMSDEVPREGHMHCKVFEWTSSPSSLITDGGTLGGIGATVSVVGDRSPPTSRRLDLESRETGGAMAGSSMSEGNLDGDMGSASSGASPTISAVGPFASGALVRSLLVDAAREVAAGGNAAPVWLQSEPAVLQYITDVSRAGERTARADAAAASIALRRSVRRARSVGRDQGEREASVSPARRGRQSDVRSVHRHRPAGGGKGSRGNGRARSGEPRWRRGRRERSRRAADSFRGRRETARLLRHGDPEDSGGGQLVLAGGLVSVPEQRLLEFASEAAGRGGIVVVPLVVRGGRVVSDSPLLDSHGVTVTGSGTGTAVVVGWVEIRPPQAHGEYRRAVDDASVARGSPESAMGASGRSQGPRQMPRWWQARDGDPTVASWGLLAGVSAAFLRASACWDSAASSARANTLQIKDLQGKLQLEVELSGLRQTLAADRTTRRAMRGSAESGGLFAGLQSIAGALSAFIDRVARPRTNRLRKSRGGASHGGSRDRVSGFSAASIAWVDSGTDSSLGAAIPASSHRAAASEFLRSLVKRPTDGVGRHARSLESGGAASGTRRPFQAKSASSTPPARDGGADHFDMAGTPGAAVAQLMRHGRSTKTTCWEASEIPDFVDGILTDGQVSSSAYDGTSDDGGDREELTHDALPGCYMQLLSGNDALDGLQLLGLPLTPKGERNHRGARRRGKVDSRRPAVFGRGAPDRGGTGVRLVRESGGVGSDSSGSYTQDFEEDDDEPYGTSAGDNGLTRAGNSDPDSSGDESFDSFSPEERSLPMLLVVIGGQPSGGVFCGVAVSWFEVDVESDESLADGEGQLSNGECGVSSRSYYAHDALRRAGVVAARFIDELVGTQRAAHAAVAAQESQRRVQQVLALAAALGGGTGSVLAPEDHERLRAVFPWMAQIIHDGAPGQPADRNGPSDDTPSLAQTHGHGIRRGSIFDTVSPAAATSKQDKLGARSSPVHPWIRQARRTSSAMATLADAVAAGSVARAAIHGTPPPASSMLAASTPVIGISTHGAFDSDFDPIGLSAAGFKQQVQAGLLVRGAAAAASTGAAIATLSIVAADRSAVVQSLSRHLGAASMPVRRAPRSWYSVVCGPEPALPALGVKALLKLGVVVSLQCDASGGSRGVSQRDSLTASRGVDLELQEEASEAAAKVLDLCVATEADDSHARPTASASLDAFALQHATITSTKQRLDLGRLKGHSAVLGRCAAIAIEIDPSVSSELQRLLGKTRDSNGSTEFMVQSSEQPATRHALVLNLIGLEPTAQLDTPSQGKGSTDGAFDRQSTDQARALAPLHLSAAASSLKRCAAACLATQTRHLITAAEEAGGVAEATSASQASLRCCAAVLRACGAEVADVFLYDDEDQRLKSACGLPEVIDSQSTSSQGGSEVDMGRSGQPGAVGTAAYEKEVGQLPAGARIGTGLECLPGIGPIGVCVESGETVYIRAAPAAAREGSSQGEQRLRRRGSMRGAGIAGAPAVGAGEDLLAGRSGFVLPLFEPVHSGEEGVVGCLLVLMRRETHVNPSVRPGGYISGSSPRRGSVMHADSGQYSGLAGSPTAGVDILPGPSPESSEAAQSEIAPVGSGLPGPGVESAAQLLGRVLVAALEASRARTHAVSAARLEGQTDVLRNLREEGLDLAGSDDGHDAEGLGDASNHPAEPIHSLSSDDVDEHGSGAILESKARGIVQALQRGRAAEADLQESVARERQLHDALATLKRRFIDIVQAAARNSGRLPSGTFGGSDVQVLEAAETALRASGPRQGGKGGASVVDDATSDGQSQEQSGIPGALEGWLQQASDGAALEEQALEVHADRAAAQALSGGAEVGQTIDSPAVVGFATNTGQSRPISPGSQNTGPSSPSPPLRGGSSRLIASAGTTSVLRAPESSGLQSQGGSESHAQLPQLSHISGGLPVRPPSRLSPQDLSRLQVDSEAPVRAEAGVAPTTARGGQRAEAYSSSVKHIGGAAAQTLGTGRDKDALESAAQHASPDSPSGLATPRSVRFVPEFESPIGGQLARAGKGDEPPLTQDEDGLSGRSRAFSFSSEAQASKAVSSSPGFGPARAVALPRDTVGSARPTTALSSGVGLGSSPERQRAAARLRSARSRLVMHGCAGALSMEGGLRLAVKRLREDLSYEGAAVWEVKREQTGSHRLDVAAVSLQTASSSDVRVSRPMHELEGLLGWCYRRAELVSVQDVQSDRRYDPAVDCLPGLPLRSILLVPLIAADKSFRMQESTSGLGQDYSHAGTLSLQGSPPRRPRSGRAEPRSVVIGVLALYNKIDLASPPSEDDAIVAETVALSLALEVRSNSARLALLSRIRQGAKQLRAAEGETLSRLGIARRRAKIVSLAALALASAHDDAGLIEAISRGANVLFSSQCQQTVSVQGQPRNPAVELPTRCFLLRRSHDGRFLVPIGKTCGAEKAADSTFVPVAGSLSGRALQLGKPQTTGDFAANLGPAGVGGGFSPKPLLGRTQRMPGGPKGGGDLHDSEKMLAGRWQRVNSHGGRSVTVEAHRRARAILALPVEGEIGVPVGVLLVVRDGIAPREGSPRSRAMSAPRLPTRSILSARGRGVREDDKGLRARTWSKSSPFQRSKSVGRAMGHLLQSASGRSLLTSRHRTVDADAQSISSLLPLTPRGRSRGLLPHSKAARVVDSSAITIGVLPQAQSSRALLQTSGSRSSDGQLPVGASQTDYPRPRIGIGEGAEDSHEVQQVVEKGTEGVGGIVSSAEEMQLHTEDEQHEIARHLRSDPDAGPTAALALSASDFEGQADSSIPPDFGPEEVVLGRHFAQHVAAAMRRAAHSGEKDAALQAAVAGLAASQQSRVSTELDANRMLQAANDERQQALYELEDLRTAVASVASLNADSSRFKGSSTRVAEPGVVVAAGVAARMGVDGSRQLLWLDDSIDETSGDDMQQEASHELRKIFSGLLAAWNSPSVSGGEVSCPLSTCSLVLAEEWGEEDAEQNLRSAVVVPLVADHDGSLASREQATDLHATALDCFKSGEVTVAPNRGEAVADQGSSAHFSIGLPLLHVFGGKASDQPRSNGPGAVLLLEGVQQWLVESPARLQAMACVCDLELRQQIAQLQLSVTGRATQEILAETQHLKDALRRRGDLAVAHERLLRRSTVRGVSLAASQLAPVVCGGEAARILLSKSGGRLELRGADGGFVESICEGIAAACCQRAVLAISESLSANSDGQQPESEAAQCISRGDAVLATALLSELVQDATQDVRLHPSERLVLPLGALLAVPLLVMPAPVEDISMVEDAQSLKAGRGAVGVRCVGVLLIASGASSVKPIANVSEAAAPFATIVGRSVDDCVWRDSSTETVAKTLEQLEASKSSEATTRQAHSEVIKAARTLVADSREAARFSAASIRVLTVGVGRADSLLRIEGGGSSGVEESKTDRGSDDRQGAEGYRAPNNFEFRRVLESSMHKIVERADDADAPVVAAVRLWACEPIEEVSARPSSVEVSSAAEADGRRRDWQSWSVIANAAATGVTDGAVLETATVPRLRGLVGSCASLRQTVVAQSIGQDPRTESVEMNLRLDRPLGAEEHEAETQFSAVPCICIPIFGDPQLHAETQFEPSSDKSSRKLGSDSPVEVVLQLVLRMGADLSPDDLEAVVTRAEGLATAVAIRIERRSVTIEANDQWRRLGRATLELRGAADATEQAAETALERDAAVREARLSRREAKGTKQFLATMRRCLRAQVASTQAVLQLCRSPTVARSTGAREFTDNARTREEEASLARLMCAAGRAVGAGEVWLLAPPEGMTSVDRADVVPAEHLQPTEAAGMQLAESFALATSIPGKTLEGRSTRERGGSQSSVSPGVFRAADFAIVAAVRRTSTSSAVEGLESGWKRAAIGRGKPDRSDTKQLPLARDALKPHVLVVLEQACRMRKVLSVAPLTGASAGGGRARHSQGFQRGIMCCPGGFVVDGDDTKGKRFALLFVGEGIAAFGGAEEEAGATLVDACGAVLAAARLSTRHAALRASVVQSSVAAREALQETVGELYGTAASLQASSERLQQSENAREKATAKCASLATRLERMERRYKRREAELQSAKEEAAEGVAAAARARSEKASLEQRVAVLRRATLVAGDGTMANFGSGETATIDSTQGEDMPLDPARQAGFARTGSSALLQESAWAQRAYEAEAEVAASKAVADEANTKLSGALQEKERLEEDLAAATARADATAAEESVLRATVEELHKEAEQTRQELEDTRGSLRASQLAMGQSTTAAQQQAAEVSRQRRAAGVLRQAYSQLQATHQAVLGRQLKEAEGVK